MQNQCSRHRKAEKQEARLGGIFAALVMCGLTGLVLQHVMGSQANSICRVRHFCPGLNVGLVRVITDNCGHVNLSRLLFFYTGPLLQNPSSPAPAPSFPLPLAIRLPLSRLPYPSPVLIPLHLPFGPPAF